MKKIAAERYRNVDFSRARRGAVVPSAPGKIKISIRLDHAVIDFFRAAVDRAGGGNYQTLINAALLEHIRGGAALDAIRHAVREELASYRASRPGTSRKRRAPSRAMSGRRGLDRVAGRR